MNTITKINRSGALIFGINHHVLILQNDAIDHNGVLLMCYDQCNQITQYYNFDYGKLRVDINDYWQTFYLPPKRNILI